MRARKTWWILGSAALVALVVSLGVAWVWYAKPAETPFSGPASTAAPVFSDRTIQFGLTAGHRQGDDRLTGLDETLGSGACAFDYDRDGWVDLFIVNGAGDIRYYGVRHWWQDAGGHRLLRNQDGERFVDQTARAGIKAMTNGMGCVAADFDADGYEDLLITNVGSSLLLRNNRDGTFTDVSAASGLAASGWRTAAAVADADGDGLPDLYVGGLIDFEKGARTYEPDSQFRPDTSPLFDSALYPALANHLYRNLGDFRFEDVTATAGVAVADGRTLAALWTDVNEDGRPDLIVANATGTGSTTGFINRGDWRFESLGLQGRIDSALSFRGITTGDLDNDGRAELLLTGASGNQTALLFRSADASAGGPAFADEARSWQLASERYAALSPWSPVLADFNNDGWTDLFIVNGQVTPDPDSPHVTGGQPKQLWRNGGDSRLHAVHPEPASPLLDRQSGRGAIVADFDNNGRLDLYVAHNNDLGQLLINETPSPGHWLGVRLIDSPDGTGVVGTRAAVTTAQGTQVRWLTKGTGFLSDSDSRLHFGLGTDSVATLAITWPDGSHRLYRDVPVDGYVDVAHTGDLVRVPGRPPATGALPPDLANENADTRAEFFAALATARHGRAAEPALRQALHDPDPQVRAGVIQALAREQQANGLGLLLDFLNDPDDANAALAVDAVCSYEEEFATRYLLRMFSHPAASVRRQTAECFAGYFEGFQSQQAVIHRKYLAVPYLAGLLADPDPGVRVATARTLGAAERFRGVPPLIEALDDPEWAVRQEAIRALGLIRERSALPALERQMAAADLQPATYARLFIAQQRLGKPDLDGVLADFASGRAQFGGVPQTTRLAALLAILTEDDGIVFPQASIGELASAAFGSAGRDSAAALLYAQIVEKSTAPPLAGSLAPLLASPDPALRLAAYQADFAVRPDHRTRTTGAALRDAEPAVRIGVLERVAAENTSLPDALLRAALEDPATRYAAINALRTIESAPIRRLLVDWAQSASASNEIRIASLRALQRDRHGAGFPAGWNKDADAELLIAMLGFEMSQLPRIYVSKSAPPFLRRYVDSGVPEVRRAVVDALSAREEIWAKQQMLAFLNDMSDPPLRRYVLENLPPDYLYRGSALLGIAANPGDPLRHEALRRIRGTDDEPAITALQAIAADPAVDVLARVLAAVALPESDQGNALATLLNR